MVTGLFKKLIKPETAVVETDVEEFIREINLNLGIVTGEVIEDDLLPICEAIDRELIYAMGYNPDELPAIIQNVTDQFCNKTVEEIAYHNGKIPLNELQCRATLYVTGYQAGLRAR